MTANPFGLDATGLLLWGYLVAHLIADIGLQSHWMAMHKASRRTPAQRHGDGLMTPPRMYQPPTRWWDRHPAAYAHAGVHFVAQAFVFGWVSLPLAVVHLLIDTRKPVEWWSCLMRQTQPEGATAKIVPIEESFVGTESYRPLFDVGTLVRMGLDQAFHVVTITAAALLVTL